MKDCPPVHIRKIHWKTAGQEKFDRVMPAPLYCTHQRGGVAGICRRVHLCSLTKESLVVIINGQIKDFAVVFFGIFVTWSRRKLMTGTCPPSEALK